MISPEIENILYPFLISKVQEQNGELLIINGIEDHAHLLVQLSPQHNLSQFVKILKGSSSHFLTKKSGLGVDFKWQAGYGIFTVGFKELPIIKTYIQNQKEHHKKQTTIGDLEIDAIVTPG